MVYMNSLSSGLDILSPVLLFTQIGLCSDLTYTNTKVDINEIKP